MGKFRARLSIGSYATIQEADFGQTGDVPVPADYDGDGKTDFGVLRRGGLNGQSWSDTEFWWIWCPSTSGGVCPPPNTCTQPTNCTHWGYQNDVALPGMNFGGDTTRPEVAVYRPTDRYLYWRRIDGTASGSFYTRFEDGIVLLPGLYDTDNKTDLVAYNPANARFFMLLSTLNWDGSQGIARYFDVALRPNALSATDAGSNAPAVRHGGVPIAARANGRQALSVWDPSTAVWYTMWNPVTSSTVQSCQWGAARDVPLSGLDQDQNGYSDLAVFRPTTQTAYLKNSTCTGSTYAFSIPNSSPRSVVGTVPDMKGSDDGMRDILVLDPDTMTWYRYYSQWNGPFVAQPALSLGNIGALGL